MRIFARIWILSAALLTGCNAIQGLLAQPQIATHTSQSPQPRQSPLVFVFNLDKPTPPPSETATVSYRVDWGMIFYHKVQPPINAKEGIRVEFPRLPYKGLGGIILGIENLRVQSSTRGLIPFRMVTFSATESLILPTESIEENPDKLYMTGEIQLVTAYGAAINPATTVLEGDIIPSTLASVSFYVNEVPLRFALE